MKSSEEPSTSKVAESVKLNIPTTPTHSTTNITTTNTPLTLGQIGKQGSLNFRQSLLYDSDVDDQTLLLRPPSIRSHKFIIIPASSNMTQDKKIPTALSTTSLTSLHKLPLRSPTNQNLSELIAKTTTTSTPPALASPRISTNKIRTTQQLPKTKTETEMTATSLLNRSDVIHQSKESESRRAQPTTTAIASSNNNTSVKFTIEDYESDNAIDATTNTTKTTLDALYSYNMPAITSIYSVKSNNKSNFTLPSSQLSLTSPSTTTSQQPLLASSSTPEPQPTIVLAKSPTTPSVRPVSALFASNSYSNNYQIGTLSANVTPSLGTGLRPRNDRNSSMRSVVSGEQISY